MHKTVKCINAFKIIFCSCRKGVGSSNDVISSDSPQSHESCFKTSFTSVRICGVVDKLLNVLVL